MTPTQLELHRAHKARLFKWSKEAKKLQPPPVPIVPDPEPVAASPEPEVVQPTDVLDFDLERAIRAAQQITDGLTVGSHSNGRPRLLIRHVLTEAADYFDMGVTEFLSRRRSFSIVRPRQIAMYIAARLTGRSFPEIGRRFGGFDHTTVLHAFNRVPRLMREDDRLRDDVQLLTMRLLEKYDVSPQSKMNQDPSRTSWTDEMDVYLRQAWENMPKEKIAGTFGLSKGSIYRRAWQLGLSVRKKP